MFFHFTQTDKCYLVFPAANYFCLISFEADMRQMKLKMDSMADVYENLQEKMHDVDKTM